MIESDKDYLELHFRQTSLIFEASKRFKVSSVCFSTACAIYHEFYARIKEELARKFLAGDVLAPTAIYLAAKAEEEPIKIRDVVNVCYRILHPDDLPLEIGERYWVLRDSIQYCELFIMRILDFRVSFNNPQKYLLNYLHSLKSWQSLSVWKDANLAQVAWNLLQDSFHLPIYKITKPEILSLAVLYVAIKCVNVEVSNEGSNMEWIQAFVPNTSKEELLNVAARILHIYHFEEAKDHVIQ
eukprot:gene10167-11206_t